jgi:hypothetical protein
MEESGKVFYRFGRNSICSTLSIEKMREICSRHPHLNTKFTNFVNRTISQVTKKQEPKPYPLDYIMNTPSHLKQPDNKDQEVADRLENILKNIVVRELTKIRAKKAKPTLKVKKMNVHVSESRNKSFKFMSKRHSNSLKKMILISTRLSSILKEY